MAQAGRGLLVDGGRLPHDPIPSDPANWVKEVA